jgi:hypothetical protein
MNHVMFDLTPLFHIDFVQAALIVTFAVVGTYALGAVTLLAIMRSDR